MFFGGGRARKLTEPQVLKGCRALRARKPLEAQVFEGVQGIGSCLWSCVLRLFFFKRVGFGAGFEGTLIQVDVLGLWIQDFGGRPYIPPNP